MTPATWSKLTNGLSAGGVDGIAATVENATRRTESLQVSVDQGKTWVKTTRNINNFFEAKDPLKGSSAWVKLISHTGTEVVVKDVVLKSESVTKATTNYK
jgi:hypothetical protein